MSRLRERINEAESLVWCYRAELRALQNVRSGIASQAESYGDSRERIWYERAYRDGEALKALDEGKTT